MGGGPRRELPSPRGGVVGRPGCRLEEGVRGGSESDVGLGHGPLGEPKVGEPEGPRERGTEGQGTSREEETGR